MSAFLSSSPFAAASGWLPELAALALKGTALLVLAFAVAWVLRRASASTRHLVWSAGLTAALALPFAAMLPWRLEVLPRLQAVVSTAKGAESAEEWRQGTEADLATARNAASAEQRPSGIASLQPPRGSGNAAKATVPTPLPPTPADAGVGEHAGALETPLFASSAPFAVQSGEDGSTPKSTTALALAALLAVWLAGGAVLLARLAAGVVAVRRLAKRGTELATPDWTTPLWEAADRLDLPRVPRLLRGGDVTLPFTCGLLHPVIVLPASADEWSDERRRAVLFHELAHIRRRDLLSHLVGRVACAVYWIHPLVWMAARRARTESERACDDLVLSIGTRASSYADHLLQIVCGAARSSAPVVAIPMAQRKEFEGRMLAILEPGVRRTAPGRLHSAGIAAGTGALALVLAAMAPVDRGEAVVANGESGVPGGEIVAAAGLDAGAAARRAAEPDVSLQAEDGGPAADRGRSLAAEPGSGVAAAEPDGPAPLDREPASPAPSPAGSTPGLAGSAAGDVTASILGTLGSTGTATAAVADTDHVGLRNHFDFQWDSGAFGANLDQYIGHIVDMSLDATIAAMGSDWFHYFGQPMATPAPAPAPMPMPFAGNSSDWDRPAQAPRLPRHWRSETRDADPETIAALIGALRDSVVEVRSRVVYALGKLGDPEAVAALAQALREDESADVRRTAAWALGEIGDPAAVPALSIAVREDDDAEVRRMAAWALGEIEDPRAVAALGVAARDDTPDVARMAVWALGEIAVPEAVPHLAPALRNASAEVRRHAAWALGEIEGEAAVAPLTAALRDSDAEVRRTAAWALGEIGDPRAGAGLANALRDASGDVRRSAAWAIGELDLARAPAPLLGALKDTDAEVRRTVAWTLGEIADPAAAPALTAALEDTSDDVRRTAFWALGEIGGEAAREALLKAIRSGDPEIRKMAARALANTY